MGDYRRGRSVCAERRIARQVRVVAARHGFSRGGPTPSSLRSQAARSNQRRVPPTARPLSPQSRRLPAAVFHSRNGRGAGALPTCQQSAPSPWKRHSRRPPPRLPPRVKQEQSCGRGVEATNRSKKQQLGASHRSPRGLSDRRQQTAAAARALQAGGRPFEPGTAHPCESDSTDDGSSSSSGLPATGAPAAAVGCGGSALRSAD
jgi:hypothetical protein